MKIPEEGKEGDFVIHAHKATRFHWDLRLEVPATDDDFENMDLSSYSKLGIDIKKRESVMWSFAIPKAKFPEAGEKLLAIETEPHPVEYNSFEGTIPKGMYGAGEVKIYDSGKVRWLKVSKNKIIFELEGKKIKGKFALIPFKGKDKGGEKKWLWSQVEQDS
mgnify:CR=1 FL=1